MRLFKSFYRILPCLIFVAATSDIFADTNNLSLCRLNRDELIFSHSGKLELVDAKTGLANILCDGDDFVVDALTHRLLVTNNIAKHANVTLLSINDHIITKLAEGPLPAMIIGVHWTGNKNQFCLETLTTSGKFDPHEIPLFSDWLIMPSDRPGRLDIFPVPGLSGIMALPGADSLLFNQAKPGCWTISTCIMDSRLLGSAKQIGMPTQPPNFLVIAKDWHPWLSFAIPSPASGSAIAFSRDGSNMLAYIAETEGPYPKYINIDLASTAISDVDWLSTDFDRPLAVNGSLDEALVLIGGVETKALLKSDKSELMKSLLRQSAVWGKLHAFKDSPTWMLVSFGAHHPPAMLVAFTKQPSLGVITDEAKFIVTDGETLWNIDGINVVSETKIQVRN